MPLEDILFDAEEHMEKAVEHLRHELRGIRTGRASPALVEHVQVMYYESLTPLKSIASISIPEATQILIKPFQPSDLKAIERAINDSKLNLTPHSDGKSLRRLLPAMSKELRMKMVASCKGIAEHAKVSIRNARRDANKLVETEEKGSVITEDEATKGKEQVQELTKQYEAKVDEIIEHKKKEIMDV
ncbi:MAG: ribosome recycling factor [Phycisphaerae bacterium]